MNNQQFVKNLRRLRQEKGQTQEQLAQALGVSAQSVSRWECGNTLPDVMLLPAIARFYGITVDELYREQINAYPNYAQRLLSVYENTRRTEDFLAAEQEFARLLAGEHTADDLRSVGVMYHYMTRHCAARAEEYLEKALQMASREDWVYSSTAQQRIALQCDLGRGAAEAARWAAEAERDTADPQGWILCLCAQLYSGQTEKAYDYACRAVGLFPENPIVRVYAGNICRALGRYTEAFSHWQRCLELDDTVCDARYSMGFCYEELGEYARAWEVWTQLHRQLLARGLTQECQLPAQHARDCRERF